MTRPRFLPLGIDLEGLRCVVVGGGAVGGRKALTLAAAGARVSVVAPRVDDAVRSAARRGELAWLPERFEPRHLEAAFLAVAATDDAAVNAAVCDAALRRRVLLCDATSAPRTRVIFGATLPVDGATVAVFTDGRDPATARRTRDRIAGLLEHAGAAEEVPC